MRRIWCYHMVVYSIVNMVISHHASPRSGLSSRSSRDSCSDTGIYGARGGNRTHRYQVESLGSWPLDDASVELVCRLNCLRNRVYVSVMAQIAVLVTGR